MGEVGGSVRHICLFMIDTEPTLPALRALQIPSKTPAQTRSSWEFINTDITSYRAGLFLLLLTLLLVFNCLIGFNLKTLRQLTSSPT